MDIILQEHEFAIYRGQFINGRYNYTNDKIYSTPEFTNGLGPIGPIGTTGAIGPTGATGATGSTGDETSRNNKRTKYYKAFEIRVRPKENTKESYDSLISSINNDDPAVYIDIREPTKRKVRRDLLPERVSDVENLRKVNDELDKLNGYIDKMFERLNSGESVDEEPSDLCPENLQQLKDKCKQIEKTLAGFKEAEAEGEAQGITCYSDCYEDECYCMVPYSTHFHEYPRQIPYDWYAYEEVFYYNDEPKIEMKCHEGTELYREIKDFVMTLL